MSTFTWGEITLPPMFYTLGNSFSEAFSISPNGQKIVGTFGDRARGNPALAGIFHGFLRIPDQISGIDLFGSYDYPDNPGGATSARGINDAGDVVGFYRDEVRKKEIHGYLWRHTEGVPIDFDHPFATFPIDLDVFHNAVLGINNLGLVVGRFHQAGDERDYGYVWGLGVPQVIDMGQFADNVKDTQARGINSNGDIVGSFTRARTLETETHGYKWRVDADERFRFVGDPTVVDVMISPQFSRTRELVELARLNTTINGINDRGWIVGQFETVMPNGIVSQHGFVWKPESDGTYSPSKHVTIDLVGAKDTVVNGIASDGTFVGYYIDGVNNTGRHAFVGHLIP